MAQPVQCLASLSPNGTYVIIDNGAPGVVVTAAGTPQITNNQTGINADGATLGFDTCATGAQAQGVPVSSGNQNGSLPDFVEDQTIILNSALTGIRVLWSSPS